MADVAAALSLDGLLSFIQGRRWFVGLAFLVLTIVVRWPVFGDPNYHIDEGFYLLVGERMHQGQLPYVDIWDRKPFGLFALYWLITFFGDVGAYQIAAAICVWLTAWIIGNVVARFHGAGPGILCGALYIAALGTLAGGGGQSPVFYNLPIAAAGMLTLDCMTARDKSTLWRKALLVMLLCGIALTIKPTALFESVYFGLLLCWQAWKMGRWPSMLKLGGAMVSTAIVPTALCFAGFAALGHGLTYFDATVTSIFATEPATAADEAIRLNWLGFVLTPLLIVSLTGLAISLVKFRHGAGTYFTAGWVFFATLGFLSVPNYYDHYALPVVTSLTVATGALASLRIIGPVAALVATIWMLAISGFPQFDRTEFSTAGIDKARALITPNLGSGCLFTYDAPAVLYRISGSCLPTSRVFSEHLSNAREANAVKIDPVAETKRILATQPSVIAIAQTPTLATPNRETRALVKSVLQTDYHLKDTVVLLDIVGKKHVEIWVARPSLP
ncbi:MAG: hypothetical protein RL481_930 [Pseudomonadota bacterium]|jgi:hypothetical protein